MHVDDKKILDVLLQKFKDMVMEYAESKKYDDGKVTEIVQQSKKINDVFRKYKLLAPNK